VLFTLREDEIKMTVNIDVRNVRSNQADEMYISATPNVTAPILEQWKEIFSRIRDILLSKKAYILQERIFGTKDAIESAYKQRLENYGVLDDKVPPAFLVCKEGLGGPAAGVQVHAIRCKNKPQVIYFDNNPSGRIVRTPDRTFLALSAISAPLSANPAEQAKSMLEKAVSILANYDADFSDVPRTWMWLGDILSWYEQFNAVRNNFFIEQGIIAKKTNQSLPASTGIGLSPDDNAACAMDLVAVIEPPHSIKYLPSAGKQHCAYEYGSAFSRATLASTPAAKTIFISGTAAIDINGATTNIGDPLGQIKETIENARAVLRDTNCTDKDVSQAIAYCKTIEVQRIFNEFKKDLHWPVISVVCDICRPELLFEIEAAALIKNSK